MIIKILSKNLSFFRNSQHNTKLLKFSHYFYFLKSTILRYFYKDKMSMNTFCLYGYNFSTYSARMLDFLTKEIFITNDYFFDSDNNEPTIIDCGSNIGVAMLYFKSIYPKSKIICIEANPLASQNIQINIENNKIQDVEVINKALFDEVTEIEFFTTIEQTSAISSINKYRNENKKSFNVPTMLLSELFKIKTSIDLVKMDIEGAEYNVITELYESGELNKPARYIVEFHLNIENSSFLLSNYLSMFEKVGYRYNVRGDFKYLKKGQDVLIYFYK